MKYLIAMLVIFTLFTTSTPTYAGPVGAALDKLGMSDQVQNAGDALQQELAAAATHGESVRGASGALSEIAINSGELICNAWIISFHVHIRNMIIASNRMWGDQLNRQLQLIQKAQAFLSALERECTSVGLIGDTPEDGDSDEEDQIDDWDGGGEDGDGDGEPDGPAITPRPGETIADAICRHHCQDEYNYWQEQLRCLREDEQAKRDADEEVRRIRERIHDKERDLADTEAEHSRLKDFLMTPHGPHISYREEEEMVRSHQRMSYLEQWVLPGLRRDLERLRNELLQDQIFADIMQRAVERQRQREAAARQAYYDCLRRCLEQAKKAGEKTTIEIPEDNSSGSSSSSGECGSCDETKKSDHHKESTSNKKMEKKEKLGAAPEN